MPSIEDRLDIDQLFSRYVHLIDEGHATEWGALFTQDAQFEVNDRTLSGTDELVAMAKGVFEENGDRLRHSITNILIEDITDDSASARAYGLVTTWFDHPVLSKFALYSVKLRKIAGDWKFHRVTVRFPG
jgi:3-phenylpropionate/cinnamic acid dioxygenase small subunit